jgi:DHA1 family tetracycline resistance protein-like MFS transporter
MESTSAKPARTAALIFIFFTVLIDVLSFGVTIPVLPKLVEDLSGGDTMHAAQVLGIFGTAWALMQFVMSPILGSLSDRYGRRPIILLSCLGLGVDFVLMALAPTLAWLFVGRIVSGMFAASFTTAGAYIADVTAPDKRAAGFGMLGAAFGLGFVLGPAMGGVLGGVDPRLPFWVAAGLALLNFCYGLFVLPESLRPEHRSAFSWRKANPLGALKLLRSHRELTGLASVYFLFHMAHHALPSVFVIYASYRYGWSPTTVGLTLAGSGICSVIVQGGLIRPVVRRLGERRTLLMGLAFGTLGFALFGAAATGWGFWAAVPLMSLMGFFGPAAQALMTRRVGPGDQGRLQGVTTGLMGLTGLFGPALFTFTFAYFIAPTVTHPEPGAPFWVAAALLGAGLLLACQVTRRGAPEGELETAR